MNISEDILLTTLVRPLPRHVQQHIQLGMDDNTTHQQVRDRVIAYERVSSSWTKDKILVECGATPLGAVTSYASAAGGGHAAKEINLLQSKGKGQKGKGSDKGKGKHKGNNGDKGKSKGAGVPARDTKRVNRRAMAMLHNRSPSLTPTLVRSV